MVRRETVSDEYFNWLCDLVHEDSYRYDHSYRELLFYLYSRDFTYDTRSMDENRAIDGINLRHRYFKVVPIFFADKPCSVLEMLIALSLRMEDIMRDTEHDDQTDRWFWEMITNIGLHDMTDDRFNIRKVQYLVSKLLTRTYSSRGEGGLFIIPHCVYDLRRVDIWYQMHWYLDNIS